VQENSLTRVVEIAGLPTFEGATINVPQLVELRSRPECVQFRDWLARMQDASADDIKEQVNSVRAAGPFSGAVA